MRKFILLLMAALIVACVAEVAEAASRIQTIRSVVPNVVDAATKGLAKVGDDISSFFWRNKGAITTGTVLVTVATNSEPFLVAATRVASGPGGYAVLAGLLGVVGLVVMYGIGGRTRTVARLVTVALLIGFVLFCCSAARADDVGALLAPGCVAWPIGWKFWGDRLIDIVLVVVMLLFPFG